MILTPLFVLELICCVIEMQFILRYYTNVYGASRYIRKIRLLSAPYILAITSVIKILYPYHSASVPINTVLASLIFLPLMPSDWKKKTLFSIVLIGVAFAWTSFVDMITSPMTQLNHLWANYIGAHVSFWILLELIKRIGNKEHQHIPRIMWLLLMAVAAFSTIVCFSVMIDISRRGYMQKSDVLVVLVFVLINGLLFFFYERFAELLEKVREQSLLEQQLLMQSEHYKELESYQRQISSLHHDMRNHMNVALSLAQSDDSSSALAHYLESVNGKLEDIEQTVTTGNPSIDSVLNVKLSQLKYAGIQCETDIHIPAGLGLSFDDSVTIFGNIMDNVREACEKMPIEKRWVRTILSYSNESLYIKVDNPIVNYTALDVRNLLPKTVKADKRIHGYGLKNIAQIVEQRGTVRVDYSKPGVFSIQVMLYEL